MTEPRHAISLYIGVWVLIKACDYCYTILKCELLIFENCLLQYPPPPNLTKEEQKIEVDGWVMDFYFIEF
jgi:hypothetical protein